MIGQRIHSHLFSDGTEVTHSHNHDELDHWHNTPMGLERGETVIPLAVRERQRLVGQAYKDEQRAVERRLRDEQEAIEGRTSAPPPSYPISPDPFEAVSFLLLREQLDGVLDSLSIKEARVLRCYFGLSGEEPKSLAEIAKQLHVTYEAVRRTKEKGLRNLREPSRSRKLVDYLYT